MKVEKALQSILRNYKRTTSKIKTRKVSENVREGEDPDLKLKQFERKIELALAIIQKHIRGYLARKRMIQIRKVSSVWELHKEFTQEGEVTEA